MLQQQAGTVAHYTAQLRLILHDIALPVVIIVVDRLDEQVKLLEDMMMEASRVHAPHAIWHRGAQVII